ncbi:MAG: branched-chain amino acid ABC transporter permease [Betaproteobacteria bacterium]|nr:branched-chain amino acid ABC transporter permease [Betaproteobacteria bacterium]
MRAFDKTPLAIVVATTLLLVGFFVFPAWLSLMVVTIIAKALVVVGVVVLMRSGLVSFGQGLYYCIGGYAVSLGEQVLQITDIFVLLALAMAAGLVAGSILGLLMSRYREIFFAMFSLALSMILYGILSRTQSLGSTDGLNIVQPTLFGIKLATQQAKLLIYFTTCVLAALVTYAVHRYIRSPLGYASMAVRDNEIRVEYLGLAPKKVFYSNYVIASVVAALGGAITALNYGHVQPDMAYWSQSGEFIFIALMGGTSHVAAAFLGSAVFETIRTYALELAPDAWRVILGGVLIAIICFLPKGLWSLTQFGKRSGSSDWDRVVDEKDST